MQVIGNGSSASVPYLTFKLDHGIGRKSLPPSLAQLDALGLIDIGLNTLLGNVYKLSNRWRVVTAEDAHGTLLSEIDRWAPIIEAVGASCAGRSGCRAVLLHTIS